MIDTIHMIVAERAQAGGLPVTAAAIAEIDRLLAQQRAADRGGRFDRGESVQGVHDEGCGA